MPPPGFSQTLLSPAELSYLHYSLTLEPPIRPDLRTATQFRSLVAETGILPAPNGSARVCFSDGTEAIAGVKADVERTPRFANHGSAQQSTNGADVDMDDPNASSGSDEDGEASTRPRKGSRGDQGSDAWIEVAVEIPGHRDDDPLPVFLGAMLTESLLSTSTSGSSSLRDRLRINDRWHWKLYVDLLMLSPPLSYPLPLLSLALQLALLDTRIPRRTSDEEDDPLWDDDWEAARWLHPKGGDETDSSEESAESNSDSEGDNMAQAQPHKAKPTQRRRPVSTISKPAAKPPITLLVLTAGPNIIFDPSASELAVADSVLAVSLVQTPPSTSRPDTPPRLHVTSIRMVDPPSRLTPPGVPTATPNASSAPCVNGNTPTAAATAALGAMTAKEKEAQAAAEKRVLSEREMGRVWCSPRGGVKRVGLARVVRLCTEEGGVGEEVLQALESVAVG